MALHLKGTKYGTTEKDVEREIVTRSSKISKEQFQVQKVIVENTQNSRILWYHKIITADKTVLNEILKLPLPRKWFVFKPKTSCGSDLDQECLVIKLTCNGHQVDKIDEFAKDLAGSEKINFNYLLQVVKAEQLMYYNSDDKSGYVEVIHVEIYGDSLKADPGIDVVESICDTIRTNWPGCGIYLKTSCAFNDINQAAQFIPSTKYPPYFPHNE